MSWFYDVISKLHPDENCYFLATCIIPLYLAFVDYCKAFNSVEIPAVLKAIQHHGVDPIYINILKHIYQNVTSFIRIHKDSEPINLKKVVQWGGCISPKLFLSRSSKSWTKGRDGNQNSWQNVQQLEVCRWHRTSLRRPRGIANHARTIKWWKQSCWPRNELIKNTTIIKMVPFC